MNYKQMSIFDFVNTEIEKTRIKVLVERPEGTTFEQELEVQPDQTIQQCIHDYQYNYLGNPYAWYTTREGKRERYIKKNAYLVVSWWRL